MAASGSDKPSNPGAPRPDRTPNESASGSPVRRDRPAPPPTGPHRRTAPTHANAPPSTAVVGATAAATTRPGTVWLDGETLMCRCPDCLAPMSIRVWLMVADCWQCGTTLELSETQEIEAQRLLEQRRVASSGLIPSGPPPLPPAPPQKPTAPVRLPPLLPPPVTPAVRESRPLPAVPLPSPVEPPRVAPSSQPAIPALRGAPPLPTALVAGAAAAGAPPNALWLFPREGSTFLRDLLRDTPAWLVSLIVHLVVLTILGLLDVEERRSPVQITISTTIGRVPTPGEVNVPVDPLDEVAFNLPLPDNVDLKDKRVRDVLVAANEDARQLQIDANVPTPDLPSLDQVRQLVSSDDPVRRSLAVRDPRLRVVVVQREGGTTLTEAAVSRGLRWLARQQSGNGRWSTGNRTYDVANTALALLPFVGAGQTHHAGMYKDNVARGLRWLLEQQESNGDLRGGSAQHPGMYSHGIAAIVLCDLYVATGDEALRGPAQKAVDFIVAAQSANGGWRYFPRQDADLSVVGWQLMALQSARTGGLHVPPETLELADQYLDTVAHENGALYSYQRQGGESRPSPAMTAEGLLSRMYLGWRKDVPGLRRGVHALLEQNLPNESDTSNIYYWYYATQVFHHYGGEEWDRWNHRMRDLLVNNQVTAGPNAGSWDPERDRWGAIGGRIFMTSLSVCTLEVYYRHAPLYRRIKLD